MSIYEATLETLSESYRKSKWLKAAYHQESSNYERTSSSKMLERELIADFILSYFTKKRQVQLLSNPGQYWYFEHLINLRHKRCRFIGIEKSLEIMEKSRSSMVGIGQNQFFTNNRKFGEIYITQYTTKQSSWFNCNLSTFCTMLTTDYGADMTTKQIWNERYFQNNAAWLDFTSPICDEVRITLENLHLVMAPSKKLRPVVVTLMYGRDTVQLGNFEEGRAKYLEEHIQGYKCVSTRVYSGLNGCRMITLFGHM